MFCSSVHILLFALLYGLNRWQWSIIAGTELSISSCLVLVKTGYIAGHTCLDLQQNDAATVLTVLGTQNSLTLKLRVPSWIQSHIYTLNMFCCFKIAYNCIYLYGLNRWEWFIKAGKELSSLYFMRVKTKDQL